MSLTLCELATSSDRNPLIHTFADLSKISNWPTDYLCDLQSIFEVGGDIKAELRNPP